jgi:hypothetical protein
MAVKGICSKCHKEGTKHIAKGRKNSSARYLEYVHKTGDSWNSIRRCYIGRVRTTKEMFAHLEKQDSKEISDLLDAIIADIMTFIDKYSPSESVCMEIIQKKVRNILKKHDYHYYDEL